MQYLNMRQIRARQINRKTIQKPYTGAKIINQKKDIYTIALTRAGEIVKQIHLKKGHEHKEQNIEIRVSNLGILEVCIY